MLVRPILAFTAYATSIVLANLLIDWFGIVDVLPGPWTLMAPAAVYAVGVSLVARDVLQENLRPYGRTVTFGTLIGAIVVGAALSAFLADPTVALASAAAFLLAEVLDLVIYTRLRVHGWTLAAAVSSLIGAGFDSLVFLLIAFGSLTFFPGQWLGKAVAIVLVVAVLAPARRMWAPTARTDAVEAAA